MRQLKFSEIMAAVEHTNNTEAYKLYTVFAKGVKEECIDCDSNSVSVVVYEGQDYFIGWDENGMANYDRMLKERGQGGIQ